MPRDVLVTLPGYDPDVAKNRAEARRIMQKLGYGPDKRLKVKVSARDIPPYRDPAVILLDQLKEIYVDAELEPIDTTNWFPKVIRRDFTVGLNLTPSFVDDPDPVLYTSFVCGAEQNYNGYCDPVTDKLIEQQSMETDREKRKKLVWEIERKLAEDDARPIIYYSRQGSCWQPYVKGQTIMINTHLQWLAHGRRLARQGAISELCRADPNQCVNPASHNAYGDPLGPGDGQPVWRPALSAAASYGFSPAASSTA